MKFPIALFLLITSYCYLVRSLQPYGCDSQLSWAARLGSVEYLRTLLKGNYMKMYEPDCEGKLPIVHAVENQNNPRSLIAAFVDSDFNLNYRLSNGETVLFHAISDGTIEAVRTLLQYGSDANVMDHTKQTPLGLAVQQERREVCQLLIKHNANIHQKFSGGDGYLHRFVRGGTISQVNLLLELGLDIETPNNAGMNARHVAIKRGSISMINLILARDNHMPCPVRAGKWSDPLNFAVRNANDDILAHLLLYLQWPSCWPKDSNHEPMRIAIRENNIRALEQLKKAGERYHVNFLQTIGFRAMKYAVENSSQTSVEWLFKKGVIIEREDLFKLLKIAINLKNLEMVRILHNNGAPNTFGAESAVDLAKELQLDNVVLLLSEGKKD